MWVGVFLELAAFIYVVVASSVISSSTEDAFARGMEAAVVIGPAILVGVVGALVMVVGWAVATGARHALQKLLVPAMFVAVIVVAALLASL